MAHKWKAPAEARTVDMFTGQTAVEAAEAASEVIAEPVKAERVPLEQDADRMRNQAFVTQEWSDAAFGKPEAEGNTYRLSTSGKHYYLEMLGKEPGAKEAYRYSGHMFHEEDLYAITNVLVAAAKARKAAGK